MNRVIYESFYPSSPITLTLTFMPGRWKSRHVDGRHFQKQPRTLYGEVHYQKYSEIIRENEPEQAVKLMQSEFKDADHAKKVRVKRALVQQANRESVLSKRRDVDEQSRREAAHRHRVYKEAYQKMVVVEPKKK